MNKTRTRAAAALAVSIISILQGCRSPAPSRQAEGPRVDRSLILCTPEQAAEQAGRTGPVRVEGMPLLTAATGADKGGNPLTPPRITQYHVGRYIDPQDPRLMHEAHVVYRIEEDASWNVLPSETVENKETQGRK